MSAFVAVGVVSMDTARAASDPEAYVDFLYVDANEGSASGGHVALRLGDRTYHFGYHEPGHLRLDRDASERFTHVYGSLENRNLEILRIAVTDDTWRRVRSSFNERYLTEKEEFAALDALRRDVAFASAWASGTPGVDVRGAGYLEPRDEESHSGVLGRLRRSIGKLHGGRLLARRLDEAEREIASLPADAAQPVPALAPAATHRAWGYGLARRAENAKARALAFGYLLRRDAALRPGATARLRAHDFPLDESTRAALAAFARKLERDLVDAAGSERDDVGYVLLVGIARLLALEETLERGRLVVLDVFPADPTRLTVGEIEAQGGDLDTMASELGAELDEVRRVLAAKSNVREADYAALEALACRTRELDRARRERAGLRAAAGRLLPTRSSRISLDLPPTDALEVHERTLRERAHALEARLDDTHRYNLIAHNCVSELFAQMADFGGPAVPDAGLESVIPFLAAHEVEAVYRVDRVEDVPSYRRRRLRTLESRDGAEATLRESNVLTSTLYTPNDADSAFLFFTDDDVAARPLLGLGNLVYALGATAAGVPLAPFDGGRALSAGLRGALWSLPELAFVNVRKGSYFHVPRTAAAPDPNEP